IMRRLRLTIVNCPFRRASTVNQAIRKSKTLSRSLWRPRLFPGGVIPLLLVQWEAITRLRQVSSRLESLTMGCSGGFGWLHRQWVAQTEANLFDLLDYWLKLVLVLFFCP